MIRVLAALLICAAVGSYALPTAAHELRPGYLELRETEKNTVNILWKVPARGDRRLALTVRMTPECRDGNKSISLANGAVTERWQAHCPGGLSGRQIRIDGLSATLTDVLARIERSEGAMQVVRLTPDQPAIMLDKHRGVAGTYLLLGIEHILEGLDHLLFVFVLVLIVSDWRRLVATITSFTVAHTLTLAASTLGLLSIPGPPVEAVVALSVMFLASELVKMTQGKETLTVRAPWRVAFIFGLLHGLGFAGALAELGLPKNDITVALFMFNVGVEIGQLLFVAVVLSLTWAIKQLNQEWPLRIRQPAAYGVGTIAAFWFMERVSAFF